MIIAIDFDNTITADKEMFGKIIDLMHINEHKVVCVTLRDDRYDNDDMEFLYTKYKVPVYFTCGESKKKYMEEQGIKIDIWIDDMPEYIV